MFPNKTPLAVALGLALNGLLAQQAQAQHPLTLTHPERPTMVAAAQPPQVWGGQGGNYKPPIPRPMESPLRDALSRLDPTAKEAALAQLAGADQASLAQATLSGASQVGNSALSAMRQLGHAANSSTQQIPLSGHDQARPGESRVWLQALSNTGRFEQTQGRKDFQQTTQGIVLGADWSLGNEWRLGLLGGKSHSTHEGSRFKGKLDSWHAGAYALRQSGPAALRLGAIHSDHDGTTQRHVAFSGYQDRLSADYAATSQQAFAEFGYTLGNARLSAEPFASLGYERYSRKAHQEKGGEAALKNSAQTQDNVSSTLGLRAASLMRLDNRMSLTPHLSAGWKHRYGSLDSSTTQVNPATARTFTNKGTGLARDSLVAEAGLDFNLSAGHSLGVAYNAELGGSSRSQGVMGQWQMAF